MDTASREKRSCGAFSISRVNRTVCLLLLLAVSLPVCWSSSAAADSACDWIGSGLEIEEDAAAAAAAAAGHQRGVKPVYLRCSQGSVGWLYPRGALRVVLRYGTAGKEFQGCVKLTPDFSGANIYVEQHRKLKLLYSSSSSSGSTPGGRPDGKRHCFDSHRGQVALFVESDPAGPGADPLRRHSAGFEYDLQLLQGDDGQQRLYDPWQECRPCSAEESLEMFCSSDFVARGFITALYNDATLERTLMTVHATRVIRQASDVFRPLRNAKRPKRQAKQRRLVAIPSKWRGMDGVEEDMTNEIDDGEHTGTLHVPLTCQVKHGSGEFVFMGRKRLGDAILWCAPRAEEWQRWVQEANRGGTAQCRLDA